MRRKVLLCAVTGSVVLGLLAAIQTSTAEPTSAVSETEPYCETHLGFCPDVRGYNEYEGNYVGHDEPALLFYSNRAGSGNSNTWQLRLPTEAPTQPTQNASGGTWNFQRSVTFWIGMALCDTQGYPNPGKPCPRDSDKNIKDSSDPTSPNWVGNHVGAAFLELQFYPPGYVQQFDGFSSSGRRATRRSGASR